MSWSFLGTHRAGCGERGQHDDGWSSNNFCPSLCCGTLLQYPRAAQSKALFSFLYSQTHPISLLLLYQPLSWCLALWNVFLMRGSLCLWACWPWPCLASIFHSGPCAIRWWFLMTQKELQQAPAHCLSFKWNIKQWFTITQKFVSS